MGGGDQKHPQEKGIQKGKMAVWRGFTKLLRREAKCKGEKERYTHLNAEFHRISKRDEKVFLSEKCKEIEENKEWEKLEISS